MSFASIGPVINTQSRILASPTGANLVAAEATLSQVLDFIGSAAQGDILYRDSSAWARLGAGTAGQFLQTLGAGNNPAWASAGWVLIQQNTSPGTVSSVNFNDSSIPNYGELLITGEGVSTSSNAAMRFQFSSDGGSTFMSISFQANQNTSGSENRQTYIGHGSAGSTSIQGSCRIACPSGGYKFVSSQTSQSGASSFGGACHGTVESTSAINYVRVVPSAGNITAGSFRLFGRR